MNVPVSRLLGLLALTAWLVVGADPACQSMSQSYLCELAAGESQSTQHFVRFPATLYAASNGSLILNDPACPLTGEAWASVELDDSVPNDPQFTAFMRAAERLGPQSAWQAVPVTVSGTLRDKGRGCFAPRFNVHVSQIRFVGPDTTVTAAMLSDTFATAPSN